MRHLPSLLLASALVTSCGGDGTTVVAFESTTLDALAGGSSASGLFALEATLEDVRLVGADGSTTANLVGSPMTLEFVGLEEVSGWVTAEPIPLGTYTGASVRFAPGSVKALGTGGGALQVVEDDLVLQTAFDTPLVLVEGSYARWQVTLDLVESLQVDPASSIAHFRPEGALHVFDGQEDVAVEDIVGLVVAASIPDKTFEIKAYHDKQMTEPLRPVIVQLNANTVLIDVDDSVFDTVAAFYASLNLGLTVVEVTGELAPSGVLRADKVEILDQGGGPVPSVVIAGKVLFIDSPGQEFVLLIQDVQGGHELAQLVLSGLGNPSSIDVAYGAQTAWFLGTGAPTTSAALMVGQDVVVEFADFESPPFPAAKVEIETPGVNLTGTIYDVSDLPTSFELKVQGSTPSQVGSIVSVHVGGAQLCLDIQGQPAIQVAELVVGMKASVKGVFLLPGEPGYGGSGDPGVSAEKVKLHHGHFIKGDVTSADPLTATFSTSTSQIVQTFGSLVSDGPLTVVIQPGCLFKQDASDAASFYALFNGLNSAQTLDIKVKGVGSPHTNEVHAYEVKAKLK